MSDNEMDAFWFGIVNGVVVALVLMLAVYAIYVNVDWI